MKRAIHQAIVFFALLLIITIAQLPYGSYRESALPYLRSIASPQGVNVDFADVTLSPPFRLSLDKLNLILPVNRFPFPFAVERATFNVSPLSLLNPLTLFKLRASGSGELNLYQGNIDYEVRHSLLGGSTQASGTLSKVSLAAHPLLGSFGLSGMLEGQFAGSFKPDPKTGAMIPESGEVNLALRNGAFSGGIKLYQLIRVPEVQDLSLVIQAKLDAGVLNASALNADSSLGTFAGRARIRVRESGEFGEGTLTGKIHLSDTGKQTFGGYLALAAQLPVDNNPSADWVLNVTFDGNGRAVPKVSLP